MGHFRGTTEPIEDPLCIQDIFADGVAKVEKVGDCVRVTLYVVHDGINRVVARVIWSSVAAASAANQQIASFYDNVTIVQ